VLAVMERFGYTYSQLMDEDSGLIRLLAIEGRGRRDEQS
jgi:hypothetical protein